MLDSCRSLEQEGYDVTYLPVQAATGMVDMAELENAMRDDTLLVSVMAVNNEIGTRQPIEDIGALCRKKKILFHTDGKFGPVSSIYNLCFASSRVIDIDDSLSLVSGSNARKITD